MTKTPFIIITVEGGSLQSVEGVGVLSGIDVVIVDHDGRDDDVQQKINTGGRKAEVRISALEIVDERSLKELAPLIQYVQHTQERFELDRSRSKRTFKQALGKVLEYLWLDEKKDYQQSNQKKGHIFKHLQTLEQLKDEVL